MRVFLQNSTNTAMVERVMINTTTRKKGDDYEFMAKSPRGT
jgi:hypothetical protein